MERYIVEFKDGDWVCFDQCDSVESAKSIERNLRNPRLNGGYSNLQTRIFDRLENRVI